MIFFHTKILIIVIGQDSIQVGQSSNYWSE